MKLRAILGAATAVAVAAIAPRADADRHAREWVTTDAQQPRRDRRVTTAPPIRALGAIAPLAIAGWRAVWDRETGVALQLWGGSLAVPGAQADAALAERAARAFVGAHRDVLAPGTADADLAVVANQLDGGLRTVGFQQRWHGLPVVGGQLHVVFAHDRLFVAGSEALPDVAAALPTTLPTFSIAPAARAEAWIASVTARPAHTREVVGRVVLPIVYARGDIAYRVVDQLDVETVGAAGRWDVFVDATGTAIARRDRLHFDATATLTYNAAVRYPLAARADYPAGDAEITIAGAGALTALDGTFSWTTGADPAAVIPSLSGALIEIFNQAGAVATTTLSVAAGGIGEWSLADDEFGDAQLAAYIHVLAAKAHTRVINPGIEAWTDSELPVYVNEDDTCNGYSTGEDIHFYRASTVCENTGRMADVVFHEYGHSQHFHSIIPGAGAFNSPLSEGLADFNCCDINDDSGMGRGFYYTDAPLREIDPPGIKRSYPQDLSGDPHVSGEIISGALWDLRKAAIAQLGAAAGVALAQKIFVGVMQRAPDIAGSYVAALTIDDDDGDLGNGVPDQCLIDRAFGPHGLGSAGFTTTTVSLPVVDGLNVSVAVDTPIDVGCPPPNVTGISIDWQVGDGPHNTVALTTIDGLAWSAAIPPQPDQTVVTFTVTATLDDDSSITYPNNPADPRYQLFVGAVTPIWCEHFEAAPNWAQLGNEGSDWQWGAAGQAPTSPDPTTAFDGSGVYGTVLAGTGLYQAGEMITTTAPTIDVSAFAEVRLQYRRWLTVEDATYDHATITANGTTVWENAMGSDGTLDHVDKEWRFHDVDVSAQAAGGSITLAWGLTSDDDVELGGWTLDDVCLVGLDKYPKCGDGVVDPGEQCDDGNAIAGDGCAPDCTLERSTVGGGGCAVGGDSSIAFAFAVGALVVLRRRRT